ncbi:MFS transporter [Rhodoferax aquaticus]|uniref:MFS transporter n=2 Tax=Rhodoferax aquaticus TaxID=2527691 RepID=A0A515EVS8_9BURK|nr:MFS transporter [Rhodoferax aquaticus]
MHQRAQRHLLARLIAAQICLHACMAGTRMAAPLLALKMGYSPLAVGVLLALFSLTQVFLALPAGRFTDRHGLVRPVGFAVIASVVGVGFAVLFPVYPVLCVSALMSGGATGAAVIALQRHAGRIAQNPTDLKRVFSWLATGPAISNFLGPFAAGLLIDYAGSAAGDLVGYRVAFLLMALLPLGTWFLVRSSGMSESSQPSTVAKSARAWDLLRQPMMRRLMLVNISLASCWDVHTFVVPVLGHERGLSASVIGTILGAFAVAAAVVRVLMPLFASRLKEHVVLVCAMVSTATLFALYPLMHSAWAMGLCSVLLGLALGSVQPMIMSTLHQITPEARLGEAIGIRLMAMNASSVLMPMLFGAVGATVGVSVVFWVVGATVGAGARPAWHLRAPPHGGLTNRKTDE